MTKWLEGKKTYVVAVVVGIIAALNAVGIVVPEWVYTLLTALGLGTIRAAISKVEK